MRASFVFFLQYVCFIIAAFYVASFLGFRFWFCDLLSNFKLQYAIIIITVALIGLAIKRSWWFGFYILVGAIILFDIQPWFGNQSQLDTSNKILVSGINLLSENRDSKQTIALVRKENPDVIVLTEYNQIWQRSLMPLHKIYPFRLEKERGGNFGIALFSKHPFVRDSIYQFVKGKYSSTFVELRVGQDTLGVLGTHPEPPFKKHNANIRNTHFSNMITAFKGYDKPLIILGDLNCTPYSLHFKNLLKGLNLSDSRCNFGVLNSWPTTFFPLLIPIDHCLVNSQVRVMNRYNGTDIGSDHFPIFCEVGF